MKNLSAYIYLPIIILVMVFAGVIGKELVKEFLFQNEIRSAVKACINEYGYDKETCEDVIGESNIRKINNQTGEQKRKSMEEGSKNAFVIGCEQNNATTKYCECAFEEIIDKYGYDGYERLVDKISDGGVNSMQTDPELKAFTKYMTIEVPEMCTQ